MQCFFSASCSRVLLNSSIDYFFFLRFALFLFEIIRQTNHTVLYSFDVIVFLCTFTKLSHGCCCLFFIISANFFYYFVCSPFAVILSFSGSKFLSVAFFCFNFLPLEKYAPTTTTNPMKVFFYFFFGVRLCIFITLFTAICYCCIVVLSASAVYFFFLFAIV